MKEQDEWKTIKEKKSALLEKELDFFFGKLNKIRSNRISLDAVRGLVINYKGKRISLKQISDLSINSQYQLVVVCEEEQFIPEIMKVINNSNLGLKFFGNGPEKQLIFVLDIITNETKQNLLKEIKNVIDDAKIAIKNIRDDFRSLVKKSKSFSQNQKVFYEREIEEMTIEKQKKLMLAEKKKAEEININLNKNKK